MFADVPTLMGILLLGKFFKFLHFGSGRVLIIKLSYKQLHLDNIQLVLVKKNSLNSGKDGKKTYSVTNVGLRRVEYSKLFIGILI